ncbi:D-hexose-6-phosphate mutarotase [Thalassotalea sp. G2M2-11]|uniref:D-hexose-6-phosphate mutarotase n=1 Tax=Thalassotalea sp. G2M2-11 TaxID=2787627 RepID=UPI0019D0FDDD|nr:D-hexose-6-phosphate mutarotase [Thalassotalea sp. G2M2-11]
MTSKPLMSNDFGTIHQKTDEQGNAFIDILHDCASATVSLYGGQVLSWQPANHQSVLWLSEQAQYGQGNAIRGGIPICWPWFGPKLDQQGNNGGNHGFARNNLWQLVQCQIEEKQAVLTLELTGENLHDLWPSKFTLCQQLFIGKELRQVLVMENLSSQPVQYSSALHTYFAVSHPSNVQVPQLHHAVFDDKLSQLTAQKQPLNHCVGPIDRIYHSEQTQQIIDQQWQRKITIAASNCQQWVLWNPGLETAQQMSDVHQGGENEFVCLEAANTNEHIIAAGSQCQIVQRISVEHLSSID